MVTWRVFRFPTQPQQRVMRTTPTDYETGSFDHYLHELEQILPLLKTLPQNHHGRIEPPTGISATMKFVIEEADYWLNGHADYYEEWSAHACNWDAQIVGANKAINEWRNIGALHHQPRT